MTKMMRVAWQWQAEARGRGGGGGGAAYAKCASVSGVRFSRVLLYLGRFAIMRLRGMNARMRQTGDSLICDLMTQIQNSGVMTISATQSESETS